MIFRKIRALFLMLFPVALIASYPGGKFYGHYNRKLSKRDHYVGPDRNLQRRVAAWEKLQVKKEQKAQIPDASHVILAYCQTVANMASANKPATHERHADHSLRRKTRIVYPFMAAVLLGFMLTAPCVTGTTCHDLENQLHNYLPEYNKFIEYIRSHPEIGAVSIPNVPHTSCPSGFQSTFLFDFGSIQSRETNTITAVQKFFRRMNTAIEDVNRRVHEEIEEQERLKAARAESWKRYKEKVVSDLDGHMELIYQCKEKEKFITENGPHFDQLRAYTFSIAPVINENISWENVELKADDLIRGINYARDLLSYDETHYFFKTPKINCPPLVKSYENFIQCDSFCVEAEIQKAELFLKIMNDRIKILNESLADFNAHRDAARVCEELALTVAVQRPLFDAIREYAQTNADKLGRLVLFPATPRIVCPPLKADWDQSPIWHIWPVEDAHNMGQIAKNFLETFNEGIDELNSLVDVYNNSLEQDKHAVCTWQTPQ